MKNLIKSLEDVQYLREGKSNEDDIYEVKINREQIPEEVKGLLLGNIEWFDYDIEEDDIYITISQKQIDRILKKIKEGKIMTSKYTGEQLQELLIEMRKYIKDDRLEHLIYLENNDRNLTMVVYNHDLKKFADSIANGDYCTNDEFVKSIDSKVVSVNKDELYKILEKNEDYIIEQFYELDEFDRSYMQQFLSFKIESTPYQIEVIETFKRVIEIDAISLEQALDIAERKYEQGNIVLEVSDFYDYEIEGEQSLYYR